MNTTDSTNNPKDGFQSPTLKLTTDFDFWNFLFHGLPKKDAPRKFTKPEAFFDLLKRQRWAALTNDNDFLEGSVLALSKAWGWDRNTVMNFMKYLSDNNVITTSKVNGRHIFRLNNILLE